MQPSPDSTNATGQSQRVGWSESPPESEHESLPASAPGPPRALDQSDRRSRQPRTASATDPPSVATHPPTRQSLSSAAPQPATSRFAPASPRVQVLHSQMFVSLGQVGSLIKCGL